MICIGEEQKGDGSGNAYLHAAYGKVPNQLVWKLGPPGGSGVNNLVSGEVHSGNPASTSARDTF